MEGRHYFYDEQLNDAFGILEEFAEQYVWDMIHKNLQEMNGNYCVRKNVPEILVALIVYPTSNL